MGVSHSLSLPNQATDCQQTIHPFVNRFSRTQPFRFSWKTTTFGNWVDGAFVGALWNDLCTLNQLPKDLDGEGMLIARKWGPLGCRVTFGELKAFVSLTFAYSVHSCVVPIGNCWQRMSSGICIWIRGLLDSIRARIKFHLYLDILLYGTRTVNSGVSF